ncbi:MAG: hypothetical protein L0K43_02695, partial [Bifidobacterium crudilactis]|nr:hypothetical protein [Bifidobacterium crudilactis]
MTSTNAQAHSRAPRRGGFGPGHGPGGGGPAEKPQNFKGVLGQLLHFTRSYIPAIMFALVLGAVGTVFQIIGPD